MNTLKEMREFLFDYADRTPAKLNYVVKSGFRSYFNGVGTKIYYKSGDRIELWMLGGLYTHISVNGLKAELNVKTGDIDSIIKNRFVAP